jgi:hypothetical protein
MNPSAEDRGHVCDARDRSRPRGDRAPAESVPRASFDAPSAIPARPVALPSLALLHTRSSLPRYTLTSTKSNRVAAVRARLSPCSTVARRRSRSCCPPSRLPSARAGRGRVCPRPTRRIHARRARPSAPARSRSCSRARPTARAPTRGTRSRAATSSPTASGSTTTSSFSSASVPFRHPPSPSAHLTTFLSVLSLSLSCPRRRVHTL